MSIEIFSKRQFENVLPVGYWTYSGLIDNEHCYSIQITEDIFIYIRSSVDGSGYSAETGQDSIRAWLVDKDGMPLGSKVQKYITRLPGWDRRLLDTLRTLWNMARKSGYCSKCGSVKGVFKVKKNGPTKNKLFSKCDKCNLFEWLED